MATIGGYYYDYVFETVNLTSYQTGYYLNDSKIQSQHLSGNIQNISPPYSTSLAYKTINGVNLNYQTSSVIFNKLLLQPTKINADLIVSTQQHTITFWNTHFDDSRLDSESLLDIDNVYTNITYPYTFKYFDSLNATLYISEEGNPNLSGYIVFNGLHISSNTIYTLKTYITGQRAIPFTFNNKLLQPLSGYKEKYLFMTQVFTSVSGLEKRQITLQTPKMEWEYELKENKDEAKKLLIYLNYLQTKIILHPIWSSKSTLTQPTSTTSNIIYLDTTNRDFYVDGYIIICDNVNVDALKITAVYPDSIQVDRSPLYVFPVGTPVIPSKVAILEKEVDIDEEPDNIITIKLNVKEY